MPGVKGPSTGKKRVTRNWMLSRQPEKTRRATCGLCHGHILANTLRVQVEGHQTARSHYRHFDCL
eukprot:6649033-Prorocentrum_lima.AAC.1